MNSPLLARDEATVQTVGGNAPKKVKCVPSAGKVMATVFWGEGILIV